MYADNRSWYVALASYHGSAFPRIWVRIAVALAIAVCVTGTEMAAGGTGLSLTPLPFTLIGVALSIFLGFRNNTSYDRFWEGRRQWGALVNISRSMARRVLTLVDGRSPGGSPTDEQRELVQGIIGYVHSLRLHLRKQHDPEEMRRFLPESVVETLASQSNPPNAIAQYLADRFAAAWRDGRIDTFHLKALDEGLTEMLGIQGACERILNTPIPFSYTVLIHRITAVYCFTLPFGIVDQVRWLTPLVVGLVSYAFFALDAIGDEIEEPFGEDPNDLPLSTLSRMIEVNLIERLDEAPPRPLLQPVRGYLS